jgi:hypothetical protein
MSGFQMVWYQDIWFQVKWTILEPDKSTLFFILYYETVLTHIQRLLEEQKHKKDIIKCTNISE